MNKHDAFNAIGYGLGVIQLRRVKQVEKHGFTPESDQKYTRRELLRYAEYWMSSPLQEGHRIDIIHDLRQDHKDGWGEEWFNYDACTPEERLGHAGALIAAEIDRLHYGGN